VSGPGPGPATRRLFVAAWLGEAARAEAAGLVDRLRIQAPDAPVRWVPPENMHVTLRFLGDVDGDRVDDLVRGLSRVLDGAASFAYRLAGVGTFPGPGSLRSGRAPRVLWTGLDTGARELAALASRVERAALAAGVVDAIDDRPFAAHVTLGRVRGGRPGSRDLDRLVGLLGETTFLGGTHSLGEVTLAESRLESRGAIYRRVVRFPLASGGPPGATLPREGDDR
jgi:2'-5' RNA ligase